tara:strand:- start:2340 stop:2978 length:639 start_codon:yes stop_codon:yes gene_type:complete
MFLLLFPLLNSILSHDIFNKITNNDTKIIANLLSAFHCYSYSFFGVYFLLTNNLNIAYFISKFSISYFIWDSYRILYCKNESLLYIIHHIVAINTNDCLLNDPTNSYLLVFLVTVAELSNVVTYPLYHMIRSNKITNKQDFNILSINLLKTIQLILSFIGRFIIYTYVLFFNTTLSHDIILYIELIIVYFFGNFWLFQQFRDMYTQNKIKNE